MNRLLELISQAFTWIKNMAQRVIRGVMSFFRDIVNWFKNLNLIKERHSPFLANANAQEIKNLLKNAPVKNVGVFGESALDCQEQVVKGVYDMETDEIIHAELLGADKMDNQTRQILHNEPIVVLN